MPEFRRRAYSHLGALARDLAYLARRWRTLRSLRSSEDVPPAFRERLMLVVTGVNQCRYCARFHTHLGVKDGIEPGEIDDLLGGSVQDAPRHQHPALRYALHWAESDARPGPTARRELSEYYGAETAARIEVALRAIRLGNLTGNSWDRLLCHMSGSRIGCGIPSGRVGQFEVLQSAAPQPGEHPAHEDETEPSDAEK